MSTYFYNSDGDSLTTKFRDYAHLEPTLQPPSNYYLTPLHKDINVNFRSRSVFVYDVRSVWKTPFPKPGFGSKAINNCERASHLSEDFVRKIVAGVCSRKLDSAGDVGSWTGGPPCTLVSDRERLDYKKRKHTFPALTSQCWTIGKESTKTKKKKRHYDHIRTEDDYNLPYENDFFNFDTGSMVSPLLSPCNASPVHNLNDFGNSFIHLPSHFPSPTIDPDQMINTDDEVKHLENYDCLSDVDVQEQILIEDRDQSFQHYGDHISIDQYSERMQYKLITEITGNDDQSALGFVNTVKPSSSVETEVQNVEITPGSQDLTIDGLKFSLPCGSSALAVSNDTTSAFNSTFNSDVVSSPFDVFFDNNDMIIEKEVDLDPELFSVPFPIHDISISNLTSAVELEEIAVHEDVSKHLESKKTSINIGKSKYEEEDENDFEGFEVEEISPRNELLLESVPVIEAHDLDDLIKEYETTESEYLQQGEFLLKDDECMGDDSIEMIETSTKPLSEKDESTVPKSCAEAKKPKETQKKHKLSLIERHNRMKLEKMKTHQKIRDAIPVEIIEKIKASGKRRCTQILTQALIPQVRKKLTKKLKRVVKRPSSKKSKEKDSTSEKEIEILSSSVLSSDHDYCKSPVKRQIKIEKEGAEELSGPFFNKIPDHLQAVVKIEIKQEPLDVAEDSCKKDSGVDSGNVSDSSLFEAEEKRKRIDSNMGMQDQKPMIETGVDEDVIVIEKNNVYSRLPDYVTDIGNIKPKETAMVIKQESLNDCVIVKQELDRWEESKPLEEEEPLNDCVIIKEEIDLQESVSLKEEEPKKKKKLNLSEYRMRLKHSADNSRCNSPNQNFHYSHINTNDDGEEGEIKEEVSVNDIPKIGICPAEEIQQEKQNGEHTVTSVRKPGQKEKSTRKSKSSRKITVPSETKSTAGTVIEIDLEKEEEEKERLKAKLNFVGKMPSTSIGHCLLYSKMNLADSEENKSTRSSSSGKSLGKHRYSASRSRSRSRSYSSKSSSRYRKSRSSKHSTHRKSRRRSRSRSRGRSRSSSSISLRSLSSSSSRSRSYSKSYRSKSRSSSRSRSSRRKYRYKRHSRSRERSRRRSGSRSSIGWGDRTRYESPTYDYSYDYSSPAGYFAYMPADYTASHTQKQMEREEERRIIYVGGIADGMTKAELRKRFEKFGQIIDISVHFRERGDNYGFITFRHKEDAYDAMERGNDDRSLPRYNLCFGGRRNFCREEYADLDAQNAEDYFNSTSNMDYDTLLRTTLQLRR